MRTETIVINEIHPSINVWKNWHWTKYNREKKRWTEMIGWLCKGVKPFNGQVEIEIVSYFKTKALHDYDNFSPKFIMDALVEAGIIKDDNSKIITKLSLRFDYDKTNPRTEVIIKEITA